MALGPDDTIRMRPIPKPPRRRAWIGAGVAAVLAAAAAWHGWLHAARPALQPGTAATIQRGAASPHPGSRSRRYRSRQPRQHRRPIQASVAPVIMPRLASEADILASHSGVTEEYRFQPRPQIYVIQFATLAQQASALNRAAAMIEKAGYPA